MELGRPLFVGGTGRSGTTIVAKLLGAHEDYCMIPIEVRFIVDPGGLCDLVAGRSELGRFVRLFTGPWWHRTLPDGQTRGLHKIVDKDLLGASLDRFRRDLEDDPRSAGRRLIFDLLDPIACQNSAKAWIEMTPPNVSRGSELDMLVPGMRLVHSIRDGRDVAASVSRMNWGPNDPFEALDWWADRMLEAHEACQGLGDSLLIVQMEDLVTRARDETLARLLEFAGIESTAPVEDFVQRQLSEERANMGQWQDWVPPGLHAHFEASYQAHLNRLRAYGAPVPN